MADNQRATRAERERERDRAEAESKTLVGRLSASTDVNLSTTGSGKFSRRKGGPSSTSPIRGVRAEVPDARLGEWRGERRKEGRDERGIDKLGSNDKGRHAER